MSNEKEWYWDLNHDKVVHASERGPGDHVLGPYASRFEAENWKQTTEQRNETWDEADEAWEQAGEDDPPTAPV